MVESTSDNSLESTTRYFSDSDRVPASLELLSTFINSIEFEDINDILFDDELKCSTNVGSTTGFYMCKMTRRPQSDITNSNIYTGGKIIKVYAYTEGSISDMRYTNVLESDVTERLDTITQTVTDMISFKNQTHVKKTTIVKSKDGYELHREVIDNGQKSRQSNIYSCGCMEGFISEGANLVLQRLLVRKAFHSSFETVGLDSEGFPCVVTYADLGELNLKVDDQELILSGIERTSNSSMCANVSWQCYYISDGHLALRIQAGSPVTMKITTIPSLQTSDRYIGVPEIPQEPLIWQDDMEMYSRYIDRKESIKAEYLAYLRAHPEAKELLADFVQALLLKKPDDTVQFAREYFESFSVYGSSTNMFPSFQC